MNNGDKIGYVHGFDALPNDYLFTRVRRRIREFKEATGADVIDMSVGDVAYPLAPSVVAALVAACSEMGDNVRFKGYPPEGGYDFLRQKVVEYYERAGVRARADEVVIGCGGKSDAAGLAGIFRASAQVICDPVYPVYRDCALLCGNKVEYVVGNRENGFLPMPEGLDGRGYLVWMCSPSNPTGGAYSVAQLEEWVRFALDTDSVILYDAAYSAYAGQGAAKSIFSAKGSEKCAVELCSLSKSAGFTGLRCSWVRIPESLSVGGKSLLQLWRKRQSVSFNGVPYPVQRAAEAALCDAGERECREIIAKYMRNSCVLGDLLKSAGVWFSGGVHSPYVWMECPYGMSSEEFFEFLLKNSGIAGTPGSGFGKAGEGYLRLSCFVTEKDALEAAARLKKLLFR